VLKLVINEAKSRYKEVQATTMANISLMFKDAVIEIMIGRAIFRRLGDGFQIWRSGFEAGSGNVSLW
jgi:hypothetical protein